MSACMLTAALVVPAGMTESLNFDAGRTTLEEIENPAEFSFDDDDDLFDEEGEVNLDVAKRVGRTVINELPEALDSQETNLLRIGRYEVFVSGGLSYGDMPTEAAKAIRNAHTLPIAVLTAMGFVVDHAADDADANHG